MEAILVRDYPSDMVDIYLREGDWTLIYKDNGRDEYEKIEPGEKSKAYLRIPANAYEAVLRAALGPTPTEDVVRDVRNTRDRMITIVEKLVDEHIGG